MKRWALVLLVALHGCGGDDSGDGAPDMAAIDAGPDGPADPVAAALPHIGACPTDWTPRTIGGVDVCEPAAPVLCEHGTERFFGAAACVPVGRPCPTGPFADDLPAEGVVYVAPGGSGDGSRADPLGSIRVALAGAEPGTVVALAKGRYAERVAMPRGVTLRGACAAETILGQPSMASLSKQIIRSSVADAVVADLSVVEVDGAGVVIDGGSLRLEGVVIDEATSYGVLAVGGALTASALVVRGTRPDGSDAAGFGLTVEDAVVSLEDVVLEANRIFGLTVLGGSTVTARRLVARAQVAVSDTSTGIALDGDSTLDATDVLVEDARSVAIGVAGGAAATFDGLVVRHVRAEGELMGFALSCVGDSEVTARRAWLTDAQGTAVGMLGRGRLHLEDTVIDAVVPPPERPGAAVGASVLDLGTLVLDRVLVHGTQSAALAGVGSSATEPGDILLEGRDVTLLDARPDAPTGVGLYLAIHAHATLERVRIERATHAAVVLADGARLTATDLDVRESLPGTTGYWGRALEASASELTLSRARFDTQREVGLLFSRTQATLQDLQLLRTLPRACADDACADEPGGIGLGAYDDSVVTLERFVIAETPLCAVQLARRAQLDLRSGLVSDATIGACVQVPGYDVERLARDVRYVDTATRIELTDHYVPDVGDPLDL